MTIEISNYELNANSTDFAKTYMKMSNIGEIGISTDYSDNQPATDFQNRFPLVDWLMRTPVSAQAQARFNSGSLSITKDNKGVFQVLLPWTYGTTLPEDTTGDCCWVPLNLTKCGQQVPISLLCLKDCYQILENFIYGKKRFQQNDMINYFQREGETVNDARRRMAKESMAWFTAHNMILGTSDTATTVLKKFHGLLEVMEGSDVIKLTGTNILSVFDTIGCRLAMLGGSGYVFACHPLVYESVKSAVQPNQNGILPSGWTKDANGDVYYNGYPFIADKMVPVDVTAGKGEIWMLSSQVTGALMGTTLRPAKEYTRDAFAPTNKPEDGCASECTYYYNFGTVFDVNPNYLALISDVPLNTACLGSKLDGLDYILKPETIVPINK